jgi:hypothetical protein
MPKLIISPQQVPVLAGLARNSRDPRVADAAATAALLSPLMSLDDAIAIVDTATVVLEWLQLNELSESKREAWYCRLGHGLDASLKVLKREQAACGDAAAGPMRTGGATRTEGEAADPTPGIRAAEEGEP